MLTAGLLFIGSLQTFGTATISSYICQVPTEPVIMAPAEGATVNANPVRIEGTATADSTVTLTDNNGVLATLTADQYNIFIVQAVLDNGSHTLGITSSNPCGQRDGQSVVVNVAVPVIPQPPQDELPVIESTQLPSDSQAPHLRSAVPESAISGDMGNFAFTYFSLGDYTETSRAAIFLAGTLSKASTIKAYVNERQVATLLSPALSFGVNIPLVAGKNTIRLVAVAASQEVTKTVVVTYRAAVSTPREPLPWYATSDGKKAIATTTVVTAGTGATGAAFFAIVRGRKREK